MEAAARKEGWAGIKLNFFFKARMGLMDIPFDLLNINNNNSRRKGTYAIPTSNVDSHLYSLYPNTIRLWNSLSEEVIGQTI